MPVARGVVVDGLLRAAILISELVRPGCLGGDALVGCQLGAVAGEQALDLRADSRLQVVIGDQRDDLVPRVAPGQRRLRGKGRAQSG